MSSEFKTGIVAVSIIALFIWGFNFLKGQNLFEANSRVFYIEYDNIRGLNKSSIVTINGLQVGKVSDIKFNSNLEKRGGLVVTILLDNGFEFSTNSIAKIYSTSLLGGGSLAIIPSYEGDLAKSNDTLKGEVETDMFTSVKEQLNPLKVKLENVIIGADSLLLGLNDVLDDKTRNSLKRTTFEVERITDELGKTLDSVNSIISYSGSDVKTTLANVKRITENFSKVSDTLASANLGNTLQALQKSLNNVNSLISGIDKGEGTLGKLVKDDAMYVNLTNASKELEELLREMKLNPKRFVHFSLFGKKAKPYQPEKENR